jgi:hypothetical protein
MQSMTLYKATAALIAAALSFRQDWETRQADEAATRALAKAENPVSEDSQEWPEELSEEEWWDHFLSYIQEKGLSACLNEQRNPDIDCFAALNVGEPSFTLRGQDQFASVLVKHWIELAQSFAPDIRARKLDGAETIVSKMEDYEPQKLPD